MLLKLKELAGLAGLYGLCKDMYAIGLTPNFLAKYYSHSNICNYGLAERWLPV
jgi:hypothetical protein